MKTGVVIFSGVLASPEVVRIRKTLESSGYEVRISRADNAIHEISAWAPDAVFVVSTISSYPILISHLIETHLPYMLPPHHTLSLLDHPLHWRRVLERESVPVLRWVTMEQGRDPGRDTRVSVLGFPLGIMPIPPETSETAVRVYDREELEKQIEILRKKTTTVLISRSPDEGIVTVYHGFVPDEHVFRTASPLNPEMERLSRSLISHIIDVLEIRGPVRIRLLWEQNRLFLESVEPVLDLFENSDAHRALGTDYDTFLNGIIQAYLARV